MAQQFFVHEFATGTANPGADEYVMPDPGLYIQARHPQAEAIEMEDDMPQLTQEEIDEFADRIEAIGGNDKLVAALTNFPKNGIVANAMQSKAYSDMMLLVNAAGGWTDFMELMEIYVAQWKDPAMRMPLADTPQRLDLIEQVLVNCKMSGLDHNWSADYLRTQPTSSLGNLAKMYADRLPRDYSGNAGGAIRANIGDEQEIKENWGNFFDQKPSVGNSYESPNNLMRRLSQQSQNGKHHP